MSVSAAHADAFYRDEWIARWLPGLQDDGILVGLNWSGARATGYDVEPGAVLERFAAE